MAGLVLGALDPQRIEFRRRRVFEGLNVDTSDRLWQSCEIEIHVTNSNHSATNALKGQLYNGVFRYNVDEQGYEIADAVMQYTITLK